MILAAFDLASVAAYCLSGAITTAFTWIVANRVSAGRLTERTKALHEREEGLDLRIDSLNRGIVEMASELRAIRQSQSDQALAIERTRTERAHCEVESARRYATHIGVAQVISENAERSGTVHAEIDQVHSRITHIAEDVAKISGFLAAQSEGGKVRT